MPTARDVIFNEDNTTNSLSAVFSWRDKGCNDAFIFLIIIFFPSFIFFLKKKKKRNKTINHVHQALNSLITDESPIKLNN